MLPKRATLRCMNLLQSRAYTESKLRSKLKEGGYPQESIDSALAYVKSYHYVDDLQFAKDYIVNQAGKKSKRVLEQDLIARGVSRNEIEAAFAEAAEKGDGPDELALAQMWLAKKRYDPAQADFAEKRKAARWSRFGSAKRASSNASEPNRWTAEQKTSVLLYKISVECSISASCILYQNIGAGKPGKLCMKEKQQTRF